VSNSSITATGGTITEVDGYRIHTFTSNGTFTIDVATNVEVLVVAGGGNGGSGIVIVRYPSPVLTDSEASIKTQGSYAIKSTAPVTTSLNKTLTRTVSPTINLSNKGPIKFDMRASRTGSNIKIGIHDL